MAGAKMNAPRWVVALGGLVFVGGGVLLLEPAEFLGQLFAGTVAVAMTAISAWVALFGEPHSFSGGLPFLPHEWNVVFARVLFALVALLGLAIVLHALWRLIRGRSR
jgi:hypothetical protein